MFFGGNTSSSGCFFIFMLGFCVVTYPTIEKQNHRLESAGWKGDMKYV